VRSLDNHGRVRRDHRGGQSGTALIIALLMLLIMTLLGLSLINTTTFETIVAGNERARVEAFYAAEAGLHRALFQLPDTYPIPRTQIGDGVSYWSGAVTDKLNPSNLQSLGLAFHYGTDISEIGFKRIRIRMTGESSRAVRELEVQVKCSSPIRPSTEY
jgi:hypothetical protein